MAKDKAFEELAERHQDYTHTIAVHVNEGEETVAKLSNFELSLNLLPLGEQLVQAQDVKNILLLSEAGRRLAKTADGSNVPTLKLNAKAKATILHALDRFISEGCEIPDECGHFDEVDGPPSEDKVLELIGIIESFEGVSLYGEVAAESSSEDEVEFEASSPSEDVLKNVEVVTPVVGLAFEKGKGATVLTADGEIMDIPYNAQGAKQLLERMTGKPLNAETLNKVTTGLRQALEADGLTPEQAAYSASVIQNRLTALI